MSAERCPGPACHCHGRRDLHPHRALAARAICPGNRIRVMRLRVRARLRPGRGHATIAELWLRWGRLAAFRKSSRSRRSLTAWERIRHPREHSILLGRAQLRHGLRVPLEEHVLIQAPPRTGKTGLLAGVILHYPGPVMSTTTKHDVYELTSGIRQRLGPVHVFNPQQIGNVASTFRWSPLQGCENPSTAIRRADAITQACQPGRHRGRQFLEQPRPRHG